jgi:uncharacterized protein (TIGR02145 family)
MKSRTRTLVTLLLAFFASAVHSQIFYVNLKVFLEGPFSVATMNTSLNSSGYLPLVQPYNTDPWNYPGTESVAAIPNASVVDWVLVELRETSGDASQAYEDNVIATQAGFLLSTGVIVTLDGAGLMQFSHAVTQKLYAVIYHRNHLAVMSADELVNAGGTYSYDFSTGVGQAYGGTNAHKQLATGIWGMVSGDGDANGQVNNADKNDVWKPQSGSSGYKAGDFSMNGQVDNVDKNDYWKVNSGRSSQVVGAWTCGKSLIDLRDGQVYATLQIGTQCWMKENLNIGTMIQSTITQSDNGIIEKYCYENNTSNCDEYGGMYQWNETMQYDTTSPRQGVCPDHWHVPDDAEWCTLEKFVDATIDCNGSGFRGIDGGGKLKETGTLHWLSPNTGATNESGFTAFGGGYKDYAYNYFSHLQMNGYFWSSSEFDNYTSWARNLRFNLAQINRANYYKAYGFSVRCLKTVNLPPAQPSNPDPPDASANQPIDAQLSWTCTDPENDPLTYNVYFGTVNPPLLVSGGQTGTTYDPGALSYATVYYWKIIAHDDHDNSTEGPVWTFMTMAQPGFSCGDVLVDPRDGHTYSTVLIGTQCWMAENLNIGTMVANNVTQIDNGLIEKYCQADDLLNCEEWGGLYQWDEAMQYSLAPGVQGVCPGGWHIPTDPEWMVMVDYLSGNNVAGGKLKEAGYVHWANPNTGATNESGFTALAGGAAQPSGTTGLYTHCYIWSSTEYGGTDAYRQGLFYFSGQSYRYFDLKILGFSVRCLKN